MYGVQQKNRKTIKDLMLMLGLKETVYRLAITNSACWYGHVLRRENTIILRMELDFEEGGNSCHEKGIRLLGGRKLLS